MSVIRAYRMCRQRHDPKDATGSARFGGRWNSPGYPMLYAASTICLACREILVHLRDPELFPDDFTFTSIEFPERICWSLQSLFRRLDAYPSFEFKEDVLDSMTSRNIGSAFLLSNMAVVLTVPSIVVPQETNYLINPEHPGFDAIGWGKQQPFVF